MNQVNVNISFKSIVTLLAFILLIIFIYKVIDVLLLLFAAFVIASAFTPIIDWMSKRMKRAIAVGIIYLISSIIIFIIAVPFVSVLSQQINQFIQDFPKYWQPVQAIIAQAEVVIESSGIIPDYSQMFTNMTTFSKEILSQSFTITVSIFTGIVMSFTLAFLVLFLLLDKDELYTSLLKLFPKQYREKARLIISTTSKKVGGYVRGQLLLMFLVALITSVALAIVKIKYALLLGILAGILEIVPILGPILSAVPAVIIALAVSPWYAMLVVVLYFTIQRIENNILTPLILGKFLELHPIVIISAVLISASTLGVFGVILSPAIAAAVYVLIHELYIKKLNIKEAEESVDIK